MGWGKERNAGRLQTPTPRPLSLPVRGRIRHIENSGLVVFDSTYGKVFLQVKISMSKNKNHRIFENVISNLFRSCS